MRPFSLDRFETPIRALIFGASGGIGASLYRALTHHSDVIQCLGTRYRATENGDLIALNITNEEDVARCAEHCAAFAPFHMIINATGFLHDAGRGPEKRLKDITAEALEQQFRINAIGPALLYKYFLPLLATQQRAVFAHLSARVGSISDNHMGGWYGYRAAKAAQNMLTRTTSLEVARRHSEAIIVGLHPGTVDTALSRPFQGGVPATQIVSPDQAAGHLLEVINNLTPAQSGQLIAWDGQTIPF